MKLPLQLVEHGVEQITLPGADYIEILDAENKVVGYAKREDVDELVNPTVDFKIQIDTDRMVQSLHEQLTPVLRRFVEQTKRTAEQTVQTLEVRNG